MDLDILSQTLNKMVVNQAKIIDVLNLQNATQAEHLQSSREFTNLLQEENTLLKTVLNNNNILVK